MNPKMNICDEWGTCPQILLALAEVLTQFSTWLGSSSQQGIFCEGSIRDVDTWKQQDTGILLAETY